MDIILSLVYHQIAVYHFLSTSILCCFLATTLFLCARPPPFVYSIQFLASHFIRDPSEPINRRILKVISREPVIRSEWKMPRSHPIIVNAHSIRRLRHSFCSRICEQMWGFSERVFFVLLGLSCQQHPITGLLSNRVRG